MPTLDEIRAAIPAAGIPMKALVGMFSSRVGRRTVEFIRLVQKVGQLFKRGQVGLRPSPNLAQHHILHGPALHSWVMPNVQD